MMLLGVNEKLRVQRGEFFLSETAAVPTKIVVHDRNGLGDTDGGSDLNFRLQCQALRDDVLGDVRAYSKRSVYL